MANAPLVRLGQEVGLPPPDGNVHYQEIESNEEDLADFWARF